MVFSHEERLLWERSEVMRELEKIAEEQGITFPVPAEAYQPIKLDNEEEEVKVWEDEDTDETKLLNAINKLTDSQPQEVEQPLPANVSPADEDMRKEIDNFLDLHTTIAQKTLEGLSKLSNYLYNTNRKSASLKVEKAITEIKITLRELKNGV